MKKVKSNTKSRLSLLLVYLLIATFLVMGFSFARLTSDTIGMGNVNVARARIDLVVADTDLNLTEIKVGEQFVIPIYVINTNVVQEISDVGFNYSISIYLKENINNLAFTFSLSKISGDTAETLLLTKNSQGQDTTIQFKLPLAYDGNNTKISTIHNFKLYVTCTNIPILPTTNNAKIGLNLHAEQDMTSSGGLMTT